MSRAAGIATATTVEATSGFADNTCALCNTGYLVIVHIAEGGGRNGTGLNGV
jgi:hypothetical protein